MKRKQSGFSLVELLIVVLIIGIIAAIAIPNLLAARRSANEGSAISTLRTLHGAQSLYLTSFGAGNYAGTAGSTGDSVVLSDLYAKQLIDDALRFGSKSGYNFVGAKTIANALTPATFFFSANPITASGSTQTGTKKFCVTQMGFIGFDWNDLSTPFDETTAPTATPISSQ
ncbi:MAG TPA: prepilin-type N-terminal cleavage/methylation domain-containing protein [Pyrinomonadaceae bacterium]|nr:prepilin-type N-terminal cleavage/methylation domain-containing protein [Pyrinomonadaceae bacterium]